MRDYARRIREFPRDIKLFLAYNLLANVGFGVFQVIFNLYLYELDLREDFIGIYSAVQTVSIAVASASMGWLLNRYGTWRCILSGVGLYLVVSFSLAFAEERALLIVLAALSGFGLSFLFTPTMPFIIEWAGREQRHHAAAVTFSLQSLALTIGSLLGGSLPVLFGGWLGDGVGVGAYRWTLVAGTVVAALALGPLLLMHEARGRKSAMDFAAARAAEGVEGRRRTRNDIIAYSVVAGLMSLGAGMVIPFYNVFLTTLGMSSRQIGYAFAIGSMSAAIIGLASPAVARRWGALRGVAVLRLSIVPFYGLLIFVPSMGLAVAAYMVRQISINMAWPIDSTFIGEILPPRARAGAYGLRSAAWNVGFAGASLIGGWIIVRAGYEWTFVSFIFFATLSMLFFSIYFGRHPMVRAGQIPSALPRAQRTAQRLGVLGDRQGQRLASVSAEGDLEQI
jgi:MFS family permease